MANPNITAVQSIYGNTTYLIPSTTSATNWTSLTPASGTVYKVGNITASNVSANPVAITLAINSGTSGSGTNYRLAYQISVPANASLIITDKTTAFYITETQSIVATSAIANAIELVASYEAIS